MNKTALNIYVSQEYGIAIKPVTPKIDFNETNTKTKRSNNK